MGNRALVRLEQHGRNQDRDWCWPIAALYLHWEGGPGSVRAIYDVTNLTHRHSELSLFAVRFITVAGMLFGFESSTYLQRPGDPCYWDDEAVVGELDPDDHDALNHGDNGVYRIVDTSQGRMFVHARREFDPWRPVPELSEMFGYDHRHGMYIYQLLVDRLGLEERSDDV